MNLITDPDGDYSKMEHFPYGYDAFGNLVAPDDGYYILPELTKLKKTDSPFDVYGGWLGDNKVNFDYDYQAIADGRWRAYQRRTEESE